MHNRKLPKRNKFTYPVRMPLIDLDAPPPWFVPGDGDTMTAPTARHIACTTGKVRHLTHPPSAGYVQNPISVYYCYNSNSSNEDASTFEKCLVEVTNTPWGERVLFCISAQSLSNNNSGGDNGPKLQRKRSTPIRSKAVQVQVPKALHVSPLMDMQSTWAIQTSISPDNSRLFLSVSSTNHPEYGNYFTATLDAVRDTTNPDLPNELASMSTLLRYGFQPHRVAFWIYWQAVVLLWKGVTFYGPPCALQYRKNVIEKMDRSIGGVQRMGGDKSWFVWRPAQHWPWNQS